MFLATVSIAHMKNALWKATALPVIRLAVLNVLLSVRIEQQSTREEAQPADVILVLGAAEYRGRPSPVLRARLDHALELYDRKLAPRILTTGGPGGDPVFTEGGVGPPFTHRPGGGGAIPPGGKRGGRPGTTPPPGGQKSWGGGGAPGCWG